MSDGASFLKAVSDMQAPLRAAAAMPMPKLSEVQNWLRWVDADGYRTDSERACARDLLAMIDDSPSTAVPEIVS